ncbi:hypothetical protein GCM10017562_02550 [Streptomyces roseofulvus]
MVSGVGLEDLGDLEAESVQHGAALAVSVGDAREHVGGTQDSGSVPDQRPAGCGGVPLSCCLVVEPVSETVLGWVDGYEVNAADEGAVKA